jgi:hypothetical protein
MVVVKLARYAGGAGFQGNPFRTWLEHLLKVDFKVD